MECIVFCDSEVGDLVSGPESPGENDPVGNPARYLPFLCFVPTVKTTLEIYLKVLVSMVCILVDFQPNRLQSNKIF